MKDTLTRILRSAGFKFIIIGILSLLLLIPSAMIKDLIRERQHRSEEAIREVSEKWGLSQTVTGPFLTIPLKKVKEGKDDLEIIRKMLHVLPEQMVVNANVIPEEKKRGIFRVVVYESVVSIEGNIRIPKDEVITVAPFLPGEDLVYLNLGISDLRGIREIEMEVNGRSYEVIPGLPDQDVVDRGIHVILPGGFREQENLDYKINIRVNGSSNLSFTPLGKSTHTVLASNWADPSFDGAFLPESKDITANGFNAEWSINDLNRNYPQYWYDQSYSTASSSYGVNFLIPVDHYQKSMRSVKYAFMFIALIFMTLFLAELITGTRLHPIQYLLIGMALVIFYTLLISLEEHLGFNPAYWISACLTSSLIGIYLLSITRVKRTSLITWLLLILIYGFLFTILQLQDYSLLMGSIGIFIVLAIIMYISRKINWYKETVPEATQ